jgi:hypothetical protein
VELGRRLVGLLALPAGDRGGDAVAVGAEPRRQRLEEGDARAGGQLGIVGEDFGGARHPGRLARTGQQRFALLDQVLRLGGGGAAAIAGTLDQCPAALGNGLQQLAEERGVHAGPLQAHRADDSVTYAGIRRLQHRHKRRKARRAAAETDTVF